MRANGYPWVQASIYGNSRRAQRFRESAVFVQAAMRRSRFWGVIEVLAAVHRNASLRIGGKGGSFDVTVGGSRLRGDSEFGGIKAETGSSSARGEGKRPLG